MANRCDTTLKYSKEHYEQIAWAAEIGEDFLQDELQELYGENPAIIEAILEAIQQGTYNENWDFSPVSNTSPEETPILFNGAKNAESAEDDLDRFYFKREDGYTERRMAETKFVDAVLSRTLYNRMTRVFRRPTTQKINQALYDYKVELLRSLWEATGNSHEEELIPDSDASFNRVINETLLEFGNIASEQRTEAYNNYVILKDFNNLLKKFVPFIKIDASYENVSEHGKNMYVWSPSGKYRSNWTDSEETDINNVTSPVIKTLLGYLPRVNANGENMIMPIGLKSYDTVMATILVWTHQNSNVYADVKEVCRDIREHGLMANYDNVIDVYVKHHSNIFKDAETKTTLISREQMEILDGIRRHILNNIDLPLQLKLSLINQAFVQAKFSYFSYRVINGELKGQYLEDGFVNRQQNQLLHSIRTTNRLLRNDSKLERSNGQKSMFKSLCDNVGVTVRIDDDYNIEIKLDKKVYGREVKIIVSRPKGQQNVLSIDDDLGDGSLNTGAVINLIERVLERHIPEDYEIILDNLTDNPQNRPTLYSIFRDPIAILLASSFPDEDNKTGIFKYNKKNELMSYEYRSYFNYAARFIGIDKGVNELSTLINGEGNKLPIYQLSPAIFDLFDLMDYFATFKGDTGGALTALITDKILVGVKPKDNVFTQNPYVLHPEILKRIVTRSDIKINNRVKSSDKLSVAEVLNAAIFTDFFANLIYTPSKNDTGRQTNRELEGCVLMQPITYADKKTHFLLAINLAKAMLMPKINGITQKKSALEMLRDLTRADLDINTRQAYIEAFREESMSYIQSKTKLELYNQYIRFKNVFTKEDNKKYAPVEWDDENYEQVSTNLDSFDPVKAFKEINSILENINRETINSRKDALTIIRKLFHGTSALNEDFDIRVVPARVPGFEDKVKLLQANETVFFNLMSTGSDETFKRARTRDIKLFASGLGEHGVYADLIKNPELNSYFQNLSETDKEKWLDPIANIMKSFIAYKDGKEISFTQPQIEMGALMADDIEIELNPIIEAYFWTHNTYAVPANDLLFGEQANYVPKTTYRLDFNAIDYMDSRIEEMMASSLAMEFKRATFAGAVKRRFAPGVPFGVPDMVRWAGIDTTKRKISTIRGETHSAKTQDGNGWVDPIFARMIQKSLIESPVGDVRKTIGGYVDPQTGCQIHFKWAEDTITTYLRQRNDGRGSLEMMLKKGRSFDIKDKFTKTKIPTLKRYYNPNADDHAVYYGAGEEIVTHSNYIYQYDINNGIYYRVDAIELVDKNRVVVTRTRVNDKGEVIGATEDSKPIHINNLYQLDQAFGGAFVYDLIDGNMVPSEAVNDIIFHIVCENDMKTDFVGYFVGAEGCKAGHFNFNSYDVLDPNNNDPMMSYAFRTIGLGVLQNSDHELDFSEVTEMTQMITLLSQNGRNVKLVNQMYEDIGRVANEALKGIIKNLNNETEIYRVLGKALIDSFASGSRETLGLAQSFIRNAQKTLDQRGNADNIILPYSAETIKGSFIAAVISLINQKGIRRKYAGFGGVEVGAEDIVVHWDVGGQYLTYREVRDLYRPILKKNGITWDQLTSKVYITNDKGEGIVNPSLRPVQQGDINFGDTIVVKHKNQLWTDISIKPIQVDTFPEFDYVTALLDPNEYEIYLWEAKSKQLGQSDLKITSEHRKFSEYNTDYTRAIFYLDDLLTDRKDGNWTSDNEEEALLIEKKKNVLRAAISNSDMDVIAGWSIEALLTTTAFDHLVPQIKKMLQRKNSIYMNALSKIQKSGKSGVLKTQMVEVGNNPERVIVYQNLRDGVYYEEALPSESLISHELQKRVAQCAMGRKNFEKFLLKKGDRLGEIKRRGPSFFLERLKEKADKFKLVKSQIQGLNYDALIQLTNGETMIVCIGDPKSGKLYEGQDFVASSDAISYKGKVIVDNKLLDDAGTVTEIVTRSYLNPVSDEIMPVLIVKDANVLERLTKASTAKQHIYRYTKRNWKDLFGDRILSLPIKGAEGESIEVTPDNINDFDGDPGVVEQIIRKLNSQETYYNESRLGKKAELLYRNFIAQLHYIQTRIPSQAMQSTMELEVVDIVDTDTNYLWVPLMTHLFQGSDLDIDKGYCMGFDVDENGNIFAESDLIYYPQFEVDDVVMLPTPNKSKVVFQEKLGETDKPTRVISKSDFIAKIKEWESYGWKLIDYIKGLNELTSEGEILVIEDLGLQQSNTDKNWYVPNITTVIDGQEITGTAVLTPETVGMLSEAIRFVNIHNASRYDERRAAGALRNKVLVAARQIISDPASTMDHMMPVSLDEARKAAEKSTMGQKEKRLSIYQPLTIFEMQQQNMTGKTVIPLTATGIKSFFIISTGFNTTVKECEELIKQLKANPDKINEIGVQIAQKLNHLTFDSIFNPNGEDLILRTFANINFDDLIELAEQYTYIGSDGSKHNTLNEIVFNPTQLTSTRANENCWDNYKSGNKFRLYDLIKDLDRVANGNTWTPIKFNADGTPIDWEYFVVNAADSLGALLNAAADNAKELVLEKLNANSKFADFYVVLLMLGYKFNDIAENLTSGAFKIVTRYASDNIFDPSTHFFRVENAIDFILNKNDLNYIDRGMLSAYITNVGRKGETIDQQFTGFAESLIDQNFNVLVNGKFMSILDYLKSNLIIDLDEYNKVRSMSFKPSVESIQSADSKELFRTMLANNSDFKKQFSSVIITSLMNDTIQVKIKDNTYVTLGEYLSEFLLQNIKEAFGELNAKVVEGNRALSAEDALSQPEFDYDEALFEGFDYEGIQTNDYTNYEFVGPFKKEHVQKLYRYLKLFVIPKNQSWLALSPEERIKGEKLLIDIKERILPAIEEIKMVGAYGSINQGLKVGDFEEYNFIERVNTFINEAYITRRKTEDAQLKDSTGKPFDTFEEFDLLKFLDDSDPEYHQRQIEQYDRVKVVVNVLGAIDGIANFKEMFKYTKLSRDLISHSAAIRFERMFAKEATLYKEKDKENQDLNKGLVTKLSRDEFRVLQHYTRDLIILNFFKRYGQQLLIEVPAGQSYYSMSAVDKTISSDNIVRKSKTLVLNNILDLANFKRLMDRYIIPQLIQDNDFVDNAFVRALAKDDDSRDSLTGLALTGYKLNIPLIHLETDREISDYSKVLFAFNKLMYTPVPERYKLNTDSLAQWTIGDLFFIYNLMAYKDRIGGNSMTRLLEDVINSNNVGTLPSLYYKYITALDRKKEDIYNEDGSIDPNKFLYDIRDLFYRLAPITSARGKFGAYIGTGENGQPEIRIFGESGKTPILDQDVLSDFVFGMPFALELDGDDFFQPAEGIEGLNKRQEYKSSDENVFDALVQAFKETYGKDVSLDTFKSDDIDKLFPDFTEEQNEYLSNQHGFIIDGKIYLNRSKFRLDSPLHELMHFIAAGMKFNTNPEIRNLYYKLLENVNDRFLDPKTEADQKLKEDIEASYGNRVFSDKAEEFLVTLLARDFQQRFEDQWGESRIITKQMLQAVVRQVLSEVFQSQKITAWETDQDLSKIPLEDITLLFAKEILNLDPHLHSGNIKLNQELADIKNFLLKNGFIDQDNCL